MAKSNLDKLRHRLDVTRAKMGKKPMTDAKWSERLSMARSAAFALNQTLEKFLEEVVGKHEALSKTLEDMR